MVQVVGDVVLATMLQAVKQLWHVVRLHFKLPGQLYQIASVNALPCCRNFSEGLVEGLATVGKSVQRLGVESHLDADRQDRIHPEESFFWVQLLKLVQHG